MKIWSRGNYALLGGSLESFNCIFGLSILCFQGQYDLFLSIILPLIEKFIPITNEKKKDSVPWAKNPPRQIVHVKNVSWSLYKHYRKSFGRISDIMKFS